MSDQDFSHPSDTQPATPSEVQQAFNMIAKAGFTLDAEAYEHLREGRRMMKELEEKLKGKNPDIVFSDEPGRSFFFRKGETRLSLMWDDALGVARIDVHEGGIGKVGEPREYSVPEFLKSAPFDPPNTLVQRLAETLPEQWRKPFVKFVETGDADPALLDYLDNSKVGQAAVDAVFEAQAKALEGLARELRNKPPKP
jgi:hypothetical protein